MAPTDNFRPRLAALLLLLIFAGCGRAPSIGPDRDVFRAVDALYTGVSLHDRAQVDRCAQTLETLGKAGKLPGQAGSALERIIRQARDGQWEQSQSRLRAFMLDQRP